MSDNSQQVISFDEILRGKSARITTIDGKMYISAIDIVMALTDKDNNQASEVIRRLNDYDKEELEENMKNIQFPGKYPEQAFLLDLFSKFRSYFNNYVTFRSSSTRNSCGKSGRSLGIGGIHQK